MPDFGNFGSNLSRNFGAKGTIYLAVFLVVIGFFVIFLGWNGAAEKDFVAGQIPYVISGGLAGLGVVFAGLTLALVDARRRDTAKVEAKLERLLEHLGAGEDVDPEVVAERITGLRRSRAKKAS